MMIENGQLSFSKSIPGFLIPGPIAYVPDTDSFLITSTSYRIESFRFENIVASRSDAKDPSRPKKNLEPDWSFVLGEDVVDIQLTRFSQDLASKRHEIAILGDRHIFIITCGGLSIYQDTLDTSPSCLVSYPKGGI